MPSVWPVVTNVGIGGDAGRPVETCAEIAGTGGDDGRAPDAISRLSFRGEARNASSFLACRSAFFLLLADGELMRFWLTDRARGAGGVRLVRGLSSALASIFSCWGSLGGRDARLPLRPCSDERCCAGS